MNNVFKSAILKNILNQEFRGAKDVVAYGYRIQRVLATLHPGTLASRVQ